jgi:hypothetical protein
VTAYQRPTRTGAAQYCFTKADRRVTCDYCYLWDADFGPAFVKVCAWFPYPAKLWLNGHEWVKRQAARAGIGFAELSNGFAACDDPSALQANCDRLGPGQLNVFTQRWLSLLPLPFGQTDRDAGYWWECSMRQIEISRTIVFDAPRHARGFFEALIADNLDIGRPGNVEIIFGRKIRSTTKGCSGPRSTATTTRAWSSTSSTSTHGSSNTSKTAERCASRPWSTPPATWAATPACTTSTNSRPKPVHATAASWMLKRVGQGCVLASPALSGSPTPPWIRRGGGHCCVGREQVRAATLPA